MTNITAIRTTYTPRILPPREAKEAPRPRMSMAEDAKHCNARLTGSQWNGWAKPGKPKVSAPKVPPPTVRVLTDWEARYAVLLAAMPGTGSEIAKRTGLSRNMVNKALARLRANGRAEGRKVGKNVLVWEKRA